MKSNRALVMAGYMLGLFCMIPVLETLVSIAPFSPANLDWRFGAVGRLSLNTITPLIGLGLLIVMAGWQGHRRATIALAGLSALVMIGTLALGATFAADMLAVRPRVAADLMPNFDTTSRSALVRLALTAAITGLMAWGTWTSRGQSQPRTATSEPGVLRARKGG